MARQLDLLPKPQRKAPQKLMHVCDASHECDEGLRPIVRLECFRCHHQTAWLSFDTVTEAKRGVPCPKCNGG